MMDTIIVRDTKKTGIKVFSYLHVITMLAIQAFCIYAFCTGLTTVFGKSVTVPNAIELLFEFFYFRGNWYTGVFSTAIGIMFVVFLVLMLKNFIVSLTLIKKITGEGAESKHNTKNAVLDMGSKAGESCVFAISFVMSCNFVQESALTPNTYAVLACWIAVILITRVTYALFERYTTGSIITKFAYDLVSVFALAAFVLFTKYPAVDLGIYSVTGITVNFVMCVAGLLSPVIYMVLTITGLRMMYTATFITDTRTYGYRDSGRNLLIGAFLLGAASIVTYIMYGYPTKLNFESMVLMFEPYYPLVFLAGAVFTATFFPDDAKKKPLEGVNADKCAVDDKGVLRIYDHVTEIQSLAFAYRTDIRRIYIPASVSVIHDKAFFGCSSVTEIHCDHYAAGEYWSGTWNESCAGTVYWKQPVRVSTVPAAEQAMPYAVPVAFVAYPTASNYVVPTMPAAPENPNPAAAPVQPAAAAPAGQTAPETPPQAAAEETDVTADEQA